MPSQLTEAERRFGLSPGMYPFQSNFVEVCGARLHYADEGNGPVLLMLHGNPTWSLIYRDIIENLRQDFRCVAPDLAGFGLSEAPPDFSNKTEDHARLIAAFIEQLSLSAITLIAHDWGGPIGLGAMMLASGRITRLCLGNTWAWPVNGDFHFEWFSKMMGGPIGRFAADRFAVFVNVLMPMSMKRRKLSANEMAAFRAPFATKTHRKPMHIFPAEITQSGKWLQHIESGVRGFRGPACLWPADDFAFREKELEHWLALLPQGMDFALAQEIEQCRHIVLEVLRVGFPSRRDGIENGRAAAGKLSECTPHLQAQKAHCRREQPFPPSRHGLRPIANEKTARGKARIRSPEMIPANCVEGDVHARPAGKAPHRVLKFTGAVIDARRAEALHGSDIVP
jgi:haloalkane dehalogenase